MNVEEIRCIVDELNAYCMENSIVGYHYTRGIKEDFLQHGLIIRTGEEIRERFLKEYGNHFSVEELKDIKNNWEESFDEYDKTTRDKRIWFNFTLKAFPKNGAESLLNFFGGEQVNGYLLKHSTIPEKLGEIGQPMIIKAVLNPYKLKVFNSMGKVAVSSYHKSINKNAYREDSDVYTCVPIESKLIEIIDVLETNGDFSLKI
jgi:hypothetical protein